MKKHIMSKMETADQLNQFFSNNLSEYLDLLRQMVLINSFTSNTAGVNHLGELTAQAFSPLGFESVAVPSTNPKYGKHIFLTRPGKSAQKIAMIAHLDTVFSPEEEIEQDFNWRIENDRIFGPGVVDIKGGTVLIYMVLNGLRTFYPYVFEQITWLVALDATEEVLSNDFGQTLLKNLDSETLACLVFEGGTPSSAKYPLVAARKGKANFHVRVEGRSAHAGNKHAQGANAIVQIAYTIQEIASLTNYDQQLTFNVGKVQGGSVVNRVPHFAEAEVEMRTYSPQVFEQGVKEIMALNSVSNVSSQDGFPCKVDIQLTNENKPWPRNPKTDALLNLWRETGLELGFHVIPEERGGLSDGNLLWSTHPTLDGLGPVGNNAHCSERSTDGNKEQEYVLMSSFVPKALLNTLAIVKLVNAGS